MIKPIDHFALSKQSDKQLLSLKKKGKSNTKIPPRTKQMLNNVEFAKDLANVLQEWNKISKE